MANFKCAILCGLMECMIMIFWITKKMNCRGIGAFYSMVRLDSLRKDLLNDTLTIETKGDNRNENESQVLHMAFLY